MVAVAVERFVSKNQNWFYKIVWTVKLVDL